MKKPNYKLETPQRLDPAVFFMSSSFKPASVHKNQDPGQEHQLALCSWLPHLKYILLLSVFLQRLATLPKPRYLKQLFAYYYYLLFSYCALKNTPIQSSNALQSEASLREGQSETTVLNLAGTPITALKAGFTPSLVVSSSRPLTFSMDLGSRMRTVAFTPRMLGRLALRSIVLEIAHAQQGHQLWFPKELLLQLIFLQALPSDESHPVRQSRIFQPTA